MLVACGGAKSTPISNTATMSAAEEMEAEVIEGKPGSENAVARQQAIAQARAAGILGSAKPEGAGGPLDKSTIRAAVRSQLMSIQLCYEVQLFEKPGIAGTTNVEFTIGGDGVVTTASGTGFDPDVDGCVADVIKRVTFSKPTGGQLIVRYPFTFKPAS